MTPNSRSQYAVAVAQQLLDVNSSGEADASLPDDDTARILTGLSDVSKHLPSWIKQAERLKSKTSSLPRSSSLAWQTVRLLAHIRMLAAAASPPRRGARQPPSALCSGHPGAALGARPESAGVARAHEVLRFLG